MIEVAPVEVSDEDIQERMTALQERFGTLTAVDRAAESGDFVTLDLDAQIKRRVGRRRAGHVLPGGYRQR